MSELLNEFLLFLEPFYPIICYAIIAIIVILLLKLFHFKLKTIISMIINIIVGGLVLFLINYIPGIEITINLWKALFVGVFGFPAVVIVVIAYFVFEI